MKKNTVPVIVIGLLMGMVLFSGIASGATVTVCASGCDYTDPKTAIESRADGDTVYIHDGSYLTINQVTIPHHNITIYGESINGVIWTSSYNGYCLYIYTYNNILIKNMTLIFNGIDMGSELHGFITSYSGNNVTVENINYISYSSGTNTNICFLYIDQAPNSNLKNCVINLNNTIGVRTWYTASVNISQCSFINAYRAISLEYTSPTFAYIWDNKFINSSDSHIYGFVSATTYFNVTPYEATAITGGCYIGGNYWDNMNCTDYNSTTCICNDSFEVLAGSGVYDYVPLKLGCTCGETPEPSADNCTWNKTAYTITDTYPAMQFNYTISNPDLTNYDYYFWSFDVDNSHYWGGEILNVSNNSILVNTTGECLYTGYHRGSVRPYNKTSASYESSLCSHYACITHSIPEVTGIAFNESVYDITVTNKTFNITYNLNYPKTDCYTYKMGLYRCLSDALCPEGSVSLIREYTISNPENEFIEGIFLTTDVDGRYIVNITVYNLYDELITSNKTSIYATLISGVIPDYYLNYSKDSYNVSEGVTLYYQTLDPTNAYIQIYWDGRTLYDGDIADYNDIVASGNIYRTFDKPGRYPVHLYDGNATLKASDYCYVRESTNSVYCVRDVYHYPSFYHLDIVVSSPNSDNLYVDIYNPSDFRIASIPLTITDYNYGVADVTYELQPTDETGFYRIELKTVVDGTAIDSDTCYCRIGESDVTDVWFVPDEITQGDLMTMWYYLQGNESYTVWIVDKIGIQLGTGDFIDLTGYYARSGYITYQTSGTIDTGVYGGVAANSSEFLVTATCNITSGTFDYEESQPLGVDCIINLVNVAGFGSTAGKLLIAAVIILLSLFYLGTKFDSKVQMVMASVLILGFVAIGFIPVWAMVIIGLLIAAVVTFNVGNT